MSTGQKTGGTTPRALIRVRSPREFFGGIALMALALFAFWAARDLPMEGSLSAGSFPRAYAGLLLVSSAAVAGAGLFVHTPAMGRYAVRGPVLVVAGIIAFALLVRPLGLAIASFAAFLIGSLASAETRWKETLVAAVVLTGFCAVLFVYLLGLPVKIFP